MIVINRRSSHQKIRFIKKIITDTVITHQQLHVFKGYCNNGKLFGTSTTTSICHVACRMSSQLCSDQAGRHRRRWVRRYQQSCGTQVRRLPSVLAGSRWYSVPARGRCGRIPCTCRCIRQWSPWRGCRRPSRTSSRSSTRDSARTTCIRSLCWCLFRSPQWRIRQHDDSSFLDESANVSDSTLYFCPVFLELFSISAVPKRPESVDYLALVGGSVTFVALSVVQVLSVVDASDALLSTFAALQLAVEQIITVLEW